jgi:hypothetical protein
MAWAVLAHLGIFPRQPAKNADGHIAGPVGGDKPLTSVAGVPGVGDPSKGASLQACGPVTGLVPTKP